MATIEGSVAGGKASETTAWVGGKVPGEGDDIVLSATSGSITVAAELKCRSIDSTNYKKTWKMEANVLVGTTTSNAGLCIKWGKEAKLESALAHTFELKSTSGTVEKITMNGVEIPASLFVTTAGKWEITEELKLGVNLKLSGKAEFKTGNLNVTCTGEVVLATEAKFIAGTATIKCTKYVAPTGTTTTFNATTVICSGTEGTVFEVAGTYTTGTSKVEITGTGATAKKFVGAGKKTHHEVVVLAENLEVTNTEETFETLSVGPSASMKFKEGGVTTVTNLLSTATGAKKAKLESTVAGKAWKLKKTAGTVNIEFVELKDSTAEGGATFNDINGRNVSGNSGWTFKHEHTFERTQTSGPALVRESVERILSASNGQTLTLKKEQARTYALTQTSGPALVRESVARIFSASNGQTPVRLARPERILSPSQAQAISFDHPTVARTLALAQGQAPTLAKALARTLALTQAQGVALAAALARLLVLSQGQSIVRTDSTGKPLAATQGQGATINMAGGRILSSPQGQAVAKAVSIARSLALPQSSAPTLGRALAATLSATQAQLASTAISRTGELVASQGQVAVLAKFLGRNLTTTQLQSAHAPGVALARALSSSQAQAVVRVTGLARALSLSQGQTSQVGKKGGALLSQSQSQAPSLVKKVATSFQVAQPQIVAYSKALTRTLRVAQGQAPGQEGKITSGSTEATLTASQGQGASCARGLGRHLAAAQSQTASCAHPALAVSLLLSAHPAPSLHHDLSRTLTTSSTARAKLSFPLKPLRMSAEAVTPVLAAASVVTGQLSNSSLARR